jgi:hypothetical protein
MNEGREWIKMAWRVFGVVLLGEVLCQGYRILIHVRGWKDVAVSPTIFLVLSLIATALITYFGSLGRAVGDNKVDHAEMRTAITVAIVTVYLVLVSETAFFINVNTESSDLAKTMIGSFTALASIVIPSYFAASAYAEKQAADRPKRES